MPTRLPRWFLSALPALALAILLTWRFWNTEPQSDGILCFRFAANTWDLPLAIDHFWAGWNHKESYVSMGVLGLAYRLGLEPIAGLRLIQLVLFASAIGAFSIVCHRVFPGIATSQAALLTLVFSLTPAHLAYCVGVSLDFIALAFLLAYLAAVCSRQFLVAALLGAAFAFCKETSFLIYAVSLPLVLVYSARRFGPVGSGANLTRALFFLPLVLKDFGLLAPRNEETQAFLSFCKQESMGAFLLSSNLQRPEIQNYLFDLFLLNFQWLLLVAAAVGIVRALERRIAFRAAPRQSPQQVNPAALLLVVGFLATGLYVVTRCPLYNSVKYVIQISPLWLLVAYWLSVQAMPDRFLRSAFLVAVAVLFSASATRTFDPVSLAFFGRDESGSRTMLCMNSRVRPPDEKRCGNDEMIYNLQPFLP